MAFVQSVALVVACCLALLTLVQAMNFTVPGEYGCGVAIAGDWPTCGGPTGGQKFVDHYNFDFAALMASSERGAGRPVWRYDWRGTQYPTWAKYNDWHYIAMDWCPTRNEHPDPYGPWPGLLGWNEPNVPSQCNHQPWDGVTEFVALAKRFKAAGKFVVSPAPSGDAHWMDTFLGILHDNTDDRHFMGVDYLAYHHYVRCASGNDIYGQLYGTLLSFKALMDKYNAKGMNIKGLWLTEVSCGFDGDRWTGNCGATCVKTTMEKLIDLKNNNPVLKTWSWFGYDNFGNLWDKKSGYALTELGQMYFSDCNPKIGTTVNASSPLLPSHGAQTTVIV